MEVRVSADPKIVKMFRRLERFLDGEELTGRRVIDFQNVETGRTFATFVSPELWEELRETLQDATEELESANEMIALLEDDNALLALIDAQNEVLMGRTVSEEVQNAVDAVERACEAVANVGTDTREADVPGVIISPQEHEELLNLRKKRANNHEQLSAMDAKLKEKKKAIRTLEDSRDHWKASYYDLEDKYLLTPNKPDIVSPVLADPDGVTRWIR